MTHDDAVFDVRRCRVCGCTDEWACDGGCYWVEDDLCSACAGAPLYEALTLSEMQALRVVHEEIGGEPSGVINAKVIAQRLHTNRGTVSVAIRIAHAAGVLRSRSLGAKGTLIEVLRPEVLATIADEATHYTRIGAVSG